MNFRTLVLLLLMLSLQVRSKINAQELIDVRVLEYEGLNRTDLDWLNDYIQLKCPCKVSESTLAIIKQKLFTTQVFQNVEWERNTLAEGGERLILKLTEKWTFIPVLRAAVGGGTPLIVAGAYDSHFMGKLWTVGAEARTYGSAPTGGVLWARAPRWLQGRHFINFELWRDNRVRSIFDDDDKDIGSIYGSANSAVADYLQPVDALGEDWQAGFRLAYRDQETLEWHDRPVVEELPSALRFDAKKQLRTLGKAVYDRLSVTHVNLDGFRSILQAGPIWSEDRTRAHAEQELFYYKTWNSDWNLGIHQWLGYTDDESYQSLFFLGGFDSVRGIPDGVVFGNKAYYANFELRKIIFRAAYTWVQAAVYVDRGGAGTDFKDFGAKDRTSFGTGLRIAIPQVHRLMLRLDYAWSLDRPGTSSISAGLNQFFDPYRPL